MWKVSSKKRHENGVPLCNMRLADLDDMLSLVFLLLQLFFSIPLIRIDELASVKVDKGHDFEIRHECKVELVGVKWQLYVLILSSLVDPSAAFLFSVGDVSYHVVDAYLFLVEGLDWTEASTLVDWEGKFLLG